MMLSISNPSQEDLYDYVDQTVVPLLEQISSVAEVEAMGGKSEYYKLNFNPRDGPVSGDHERRVHCYEHGKSFLPIRRCCIRKTGAFCVNVPGA